MIQICGQSFIKKKKKICGQLLFVRWEFNVIGVLFGNILLLNADHINTPFIKIKKKKLNWERKNAQYYLDWGTTVQNSTRKNIILCQEPTTPHFTSLLRTYLTQYPNQYIYINLLITTIKKNKIISLLFNVGLNIFTNILHIYSHIFSFMS